MAVPAPSAATAAASALIALLSAVPPTVQAQDPADAVDPVDPMALLAELAAEPRVAGTAGYARAVAIVERELKRTGRAVHREPTALARAIPTHSDVLLYEDDIAESAFGGARERWSPAPGETSPLPPAYAWNVVRASVRGPVVDAGAGTAADFDRAVDLRIDLRGTVVLVSVPRAPAERTETIRAIASRARNAGCGGLLIAPARPGPSTDDHVLEDTSPRDGTDDRLVLPVVPLRTAEAEAIRTRLRVRRIRGEDGRGVSVKIGPGPVEAGIEVRCPRDDLATVDTLVCAWRTGPLPAEVVHVALDARSDVALGGTPAVAAAIAAVLEHDASGDPAPAGAAERAVRLVFAPAGTAPAGSYAIGCALAPSEDGLGPSRLAPVANETPERLAARLRDELPLRLDAGARWIAYLLDSAAAGAPLDVAGGDPTGLGMLLTPLPSPASGAR
ncbi:MAG: hypothetical protein AAF957_14130 [Planctomycetota bacterium]